jgi:iron complex outermembrane recepter protein
MSTKPIALSVMAALTVSPVMAAERGDSADSTPALEEIVVTAQRRTTDVQTTSIPVTVLSGDDLKKKGIQNVDDLMFTTPSLNVQDSGSGALINIRGIGKSDFGQQVPGGVLVYRDGAPVAPGGILTDEPYYDIASVEVLRGPQGTFAGENSTGGAIFIKEVDASITDGVGGWVEGQYGNYNDVRVRGALNLPLGDTLAVRFAVNGENRDTFWNVTGPYTGNPGKHHEADGRFSLLWQPSDAFKAVLKLDYNYIDHGGIPANVYTGSTANLFNVNLDGYLRGLENQLRTVLQLNYTFADGINLRSISSYQQGQTRDAMDVDGTANPRIAEIFQTDEVDRTLSQEFNLISPDAGPLTWVLGVTYLQDIVSQPSGPSGSETFLSVAPGSSPTHGLGLAGNYRAKKQNWGVFGQGTYSITDALKLEVGARYSRTSFIMDNTTVALLNGVPFLGENIRGDEEKDSRVTGKIGLDYILNPQNFLYGFVATGHKGGGLNGVGTLLPVPPGQPPVTTPAADLPPAFLPEEVTDYEIGWKGNYLNGHLRTQLGAFYNQYRNFQVALYEPNLQAGFNTNVPGTTRIDGLEAQMQGQFGDFSFDLGTSYLESVFGNFFAVDSRHLVAGEQNLTGKQQPNAPRWTAQVGLQYLIHMAGSDSLASRLDYGMISSRWATVFEVRPTDHLATQSLLNGQLTYRHRQWDVALYGTNILNRRYVAALVEGNLGLAGPPRQFGLRVSRSF